MNRRIFLVGAATAALLLAACSGGGGPGPAARVEAYVETLAERDAERLVNLSCAAWEQGAKQEVDALQTVEARVEDLSCAVTGEEGDVSFVQCEGEMIMTYDGEDRSLELSRQTYKVVYEGGDYRVCGYR